MKANVSLRGWLSVAIGWASSGADLHAAPSTWTSQEDRNVAAEMESNRTLAFRPFPVCLAPATGLVGDQQSIQERKKQSEKIERTRKMINTLSLREARNLSEELSNAIAEINRGPSVNRATALRKNEEWMRDKEERLRLGMAVLRNLGHGMTLFPKDSNGSEYRNPVYWKKDADHEYVPTKEPTAAIRDLWKSPNTIACRSYATLVMLKAMIDTASTLELSLMDQWLAGRAIPDDFGKDDYDAFCEEVDVDDGTPYGKLLPGDKRRMLSGKLLPGEQRRNLSGKLVAGDQLWFRNPFWFNMNPEKRDYYFYYWKGKRLSVGAKSGIDEQLKKSALGQLALQGARRKPQVTVVSIPVKPDGEKERVFSFLMESEGVPVKVRIDEEWKVLEEGTNPRYLGEEGGNPFYGGVKDGLPQIWSVYGPEPVCLRSYQEYLSCYLSVRDSTNSPSLDEFVVKEARRLRLDWRERIKRLVEQRRQGNALQALTVR